MLSSATGAFTLLPPLERESFCVVLSISHLPSHSAIGGWLQGCIFCHSLWLECILFPVAFQYHYITLLTTHLVGARLIF